MRTIGRAIEAIIRNGLEPILESVGFHRQARTFRRVVVDAVHVVDLQGSKYNAGPRGRFTINLGVYFPAVAVLVNQQGDADRPSAGACLVRRRIGELMPEGNDFWWSIDEKTDLRRVAEDVSATWRMYGEPWFAEVPDLRAAAARLEEDGQLYLAAAARLALGDRIAAEQLVRSAIVRAPQWAEHYRAWADRNALQ